MYNIEILKTIVKSKIGWRQNDDVFNFALESSLTTGSDSAAYQDVHPLLTLDNIRSVAPSFLDRYAQWDATQEYAVGMRVVFENKTYYAKETTIGDEPKTSSSKWGLIDAFSEWLSIKTDASIAKVFRSIWVDGLAQETAHNILSNASFINTAGREKTNKQNESKQVGFGLAIKNRGIAIKIDAINLHFSADTRVGLYLSNSGSNTSVLIGDFDCEANVEKWVTPENELKLAITDDKNDVGGDWFITYNQDDLENGAEALNIALDSADVMCSKYVVVKALEAIQTDPIIIGLRDHVESSNTFGLNCKYTVLCDSTEALGANIDSFIKLMGLQVAKDMLLEFAYNPNFNINRTQQNVTKMEILYELDGDSQSNKKSGLKYDLEKAYRAVSLDLSYLSPECFKRRSKRIKMKSI